MRGIFFVGRQYIALVNLLYANPVKRLRFFAIIFILFYVTFLIKTRIIT